MKISILQFKPIINDMPKNFNIVSRLIYESINDSPDVVVLPELWSTGFYPKPVENFADENGRETCDFLSNLAKQYNINIVGGTVIVSINDKIYNRCFIFNRQGDIVAHYDKIHLFSPSKENEVFHSGDKISLFEIDDVKCSVIVCYDLRFPELIREIALNGVEVLFLPAAWPLKRLEHWQILTKARAIENQFFVAAVNSAGYSTIINPWGKVLVEVDIDEKIITSNIDLNILKDIKQTINVFADRRDFKIPNKIVDKVR